jgi:hypothetical protein
VTTIANTTFSAAYRTGSGASATFTTSSIIVQVY